MRRIPLLFLLVLSSSLLAAPAEDAQRKEDTAWAKSLDQATIRRLVQSHEEDPLSEKSRMSVAPVLLAHFEDVPFVVCLDQVPGVSSQGDAGKALIWQILFGTGVFLEEHPESAGNRDAYMLAGLSSAVRAYRNIAKKNPQLRIATFDDLDQMERQGRLLDHVRAHNCEKKT